VVNHNNNNNNNNSTQQQRGLALRSIGIPDGVYSHFILQSGALQFFKRMKGVLKVPTTTPTPYPAQVVAHLQGRELATGAGPSGKNYRVGIQVWPVSPVQWAYNGYWTDNSGAGGSTPVALANPGNELSLEITWNAVAEQYTVVVINLASTFTQQLVWGTVACPAVPIAAFRQLLMTAGLTDCDSWNSGLNFVMHSVVLEVSSGVAPSVNSFSFASLGSPTCGSPPSSSKSTINGQPVYSLGK
jgi:hypothetical protein